jgi:hypothetical protein
MEYRLWFWFRDPVSRSCHWKRPESFKLSVKWAPLAYLAVVSVQTSNNNVSVACARYRRGSNAMAEIPVALLDNCRPPLRTRAPAVRIVASTANGKPYPCRMSLAVDSGMPRVKMFIPCSFVDTMSVTSRNPCFS